jgi:AraC family ethanolamine operon transcriptional activator
MERPALTLNIPVFEPLASPVLDVRRFSDVDQFRTSLRNTQVEMTPTKAAPIRALQAILPLPAGEVYFLRTFPRILDAAFPRDRTLVVVPMSENVDSVVNGQEIDGTSIILGHGPAVYRMLERGETDAALLILDSRVASRGWPATGQLFVSFKVPAAAIAELRRLIIRAMEIASYHAAQLVPHVARACLQDDILVALDKAFAQTRASQHLLHSFSFQSSLRIVNNIEDALTSEPSAPVHSNELAKRLGVSVRTMHSAVFRIRGMSLHHYLRAKRLWSVRQRLVAADDTTRVKASALAYGFWHLGEFASQYAASFGETPSATLARALRRQAIDGE